MKITQLLNRRYKKALTLNFVLMLFVMIYYSLLLILQVLMPNSEYKAQVPVKAVTIDMMAGMSNHQVDKAAATINNTPTIKRIILSVFPTFCFIITTSIFIISLTNGIFKSYAFSRDS